VIGIKFGISALGLKYPPKRKRGLGVLSRKLCRKIEKEHKK